MKKEQKCFKNKGNWEDRMKKSVGLTMIFILLAIGLPLVGQYMDVGSDPSKIKIVDKIEVNIPKVYRIINWSPDGEYFSASNTSGLKKVFNTCIYKKDGSLLKIIPGKFYLWSPDSKKILVMENIAIELIDIETEQKETLNIKIKKANDIRSCSFDKAKNTLFYSLPSGIYEYDFSLKESKTVV